MADENVLRRHRAEVSCGSVAETPRHWPALLLLCAAQLVVVLNFQIANVALPLIGAGLGFSQGALQWVVSANALAYGGCLLLAGRLADLFGHRRIFMVGLGLFALGSLACGLAPGQGILLVARAGQGLGAALFTPATLALLADTFPEGPARNRALGIWGTAGPIGGIVGLLGGGSLAAVLGWRWIFFLIVPIAAATLVCTPFAIGTAVGLSLLVTVATASTNFLAAEDQPSAALLTTGYRWAFIAGSFIAAIGVPIALAARGDKTLDRADDSRHAAGQLTDNTH